MAIKATYLLKGFQLVDAYIRVEHVYGGKREHRPTPQAPGEAVWVGVVNVYSDAEAAQPIDSFVVSVPFTDSQLPFPLLYEAVKQREQLVNPVDC